MGERKKHIPGENRGPDDEQPRPLFELGQIVGTPNALQAIQEAGQHPLEFLIRHVTGDWGDLPEEDVAENERAVEKGHRVFSSYRLESGAKIWLITEHDRSVTTLLCPLDY